MDTQTMMGLAAGLGWGAAIVQTLRHSAVASRAIRAERERDAIEAQAMQHHHECNEARNERNDALQRLADRTRERNEARIELVDLANARDETISGLRSAIEHLRCELGAALEQRDAATVARDAATAALTAEREASAAARGRIEQLQREVESLKASLAAAKGAQDAPQAAAAPEAQAAPVVATKGRRRRA